MLNKPLVDITVTHGKHILLVSVNRIAYVYTYNPKLLSESLCILFASHSISITVAKRLFAKGIWEKYMKWSATQTFFKRTYCSEHSWIYYAVHDKATLSQGCSQTVPEDSRGFRTRLLLSNTGLLHQATFAQRLPVSMAKTFSGLCCGPRISLSNHPPLPLSFHRPCTAVWSFSNLFLFPLPLS